MSGERENETIHQLHLKKYKNEKEKLRFHSAGGTHTRSYIESQSCEYMWKESKMNIIRNVVIIIARNKFASATAITQLHAPPHTHLYLILSYKHKLLPIVVKIRRRWVYLCAHVSAMILNGKEKRFFFFCISLPFCLHSDDYYCYHRLILSSEHHSC